MYVEEVRWVEEIRQAYNAVSDFIINTTFLQISCGVLAVGSVVWSNVAGRIFKGIRRELKDREREEKSGLEESLKRG